MGKRRIRWLGAVLTALVLAVAGCGDSNVFSGASSDDSSAAARRETGVQALNDGEWQEAIEIFTDLYHPDRPDPDVAKYLASAYVGKAGFNTLKLVEDIAVAQKNESADDQSVIYDSVTHLFDRDGDGTISSVDLSGEGGKIDLLRQAISYLVADYGRAGRAAAEGALPGPTDDERFQAGLYAAVHAVLSVVAQLDDPRQPGTLLLTLGELRTQAEAVVPHVTAPASLSEDLSLVEGAKNVLIGGLTGGGENVDENDVAAQLDRFLRDIGYLEGEPGGVTPVTDEELRNFLAELLRGSAEKKAREVQP